MATARITRELDVPADRLWRLVSSFGDTSWMPSSAQVTTPPVTRPGQAPSSGAPSVPTRGDSPGADALRYRCAAAARSARPTTASSTMRQPDQVMVPRYCSGEFSKAISAMKASSIAPTFSASLRPSPAALAAASMTLALRRSTSIRTVPRV